LADPRFHRIADRLPLGRGIARRDGAAIFDLVQGFVQAQVLSALVELGILRDLLDQGARSPEEIAQGTGIAPDRMVHLLQAGAALGLLRRHRDGRFGLARRGAALLGVPGLEAMIRHHSAFYADMADPVALLRGEGETELANFWPYVFGARGEIAPEVTERYSDLMAQSQELVSEDLLRMVSLRRVSRLMDVGGGSGAFLAAVARRYPKLDLRLFDLPEVRAEAQRRLAQAGLEDRVELCAGSFRSDALPAGADAISLVRVLYDHEDATVRDLLAKCHAALPVGGRLIVAEPMSGGARPERAGDVYFSFYTMAMGTGRVRSAETIAELCREAGFGQVRIPRPRRAFITSALTCIKPG
jgi:demethylspheroidene O-methyltransferase